VPFRPWRRRVVAGALWSFVALAALGGISGLAQQPERDAAAPAAQPHAVDPAVLASGEVAVRAWLDQSAASASSLDDLFLLVPEPHDRDPQLQVIQASAVAGRAEGHDYWAVTVAVLVHEQSADGLTTETWFLEVGVRGAGSTYRAVAAPARVAPPSADAGHRLRPLERPDASDPLVLTVQGFLGALLGGGGDVARYTAPGADIVAVQPPACSAVEVVGFRAVTSDAAAEATAAVDCSSTGGAWTFVYQLDLSERDGRWEIRRVSGAPDLEALAPTGDDGIGRPTTSIASEPGA
jgi:hypothetical protein